MGNWPQSRWKKLYCRSSSFMTPALKSASKARASSADILETLWVCLNREQNTVRTYIHKTWGLFSFQLHTDLITHEPTLGDWQIKGGPEKTDGMMCWRPIHFSVLMNWCSALTLELIIQLPNFCNYAKDLFVGAQPRSHWRFVRKLKNVFF